MKIKRIQAGAIQLITFIVVIIALLLASFIVLIQTHKAFSVETDFVIKTINNAKKGIVYALKNDIPKHQEIQVDLDDEDFKELKAKKEYWGLFEKITSTATIKNKTFVKIALVGASQSDLDRTALYLKENNKPLVLVGNSKIQGKAYLPNQGVRSGNIAGTSYYGSQLIYGTTELSTSFPEMEEQILEQLKTISEIQLKNLVDLERNRIYSNSFSRSLALIYSDSIIDLSGAQLTGHLKVYSKSMIVIDASSQVKDVILVAPKIIIKDNVRGRFQAFATEYINVGKNCDLQYPTVLAVNDSRLTPKNEALNVLQGISVDFNSKVKGVILYTGTSKPKNYKPQIYIEENATIKGEVYCTQNLELSGIVLGSVFTHNFIASQSGSIYQNHIYNGSIIVDDLPEEYVGILFKKSKKAVSQWLY